MRAAATVIAALAVALTGCGGDSPATQASNAAGKVREAAARGDADSLCADLFTPALRKRVETTVDKPCSQTVKRRLVPALASFKVNNVQVQSGDRRAVIDITDRNGASDKLYMAKDGGDWKLDAVLKPGSGTLTTPTE